MQKIIIAAVAFSLAGCASAPPGTPGAGSGATYTPFIDLQGVDSTRYANDLAGCRAYSQQIDAGAEAMKGMLGGIIVGALIGAAYGGNSRSANYGASAGGGAGLGASANKAVNKQQAIIANCMAGRGYRVLEGGTASTNTSVPSPYAPTQQHQQPVQAAYVPAQVAGQDSGAVERLALQQMCTNQPQANRIASGPGYDIYSVACTNGDKLTVRCEFGNCRALR